MRLIVLSILAVSGATCASDLPVGPEHLQLWHTVLVSSVDGQIADLPGDVESVDRAVLTSIGVIVSDKDGVASLVDGNRLAPVDAGRLLASSRDGERIAFLDEDGQLAISTVDDGSLKHLATFDISCASSTFAAWDGSNSVLGVVCDDTMYLIDVDGGLRAEKPLPGTALDITNWGDGFAILMNSGGSVELVRTPCHEGRQFGVLHALNDDVVEVVGGVAVEALALRTQAGVVYLMDPDAELVEIAENVGLIGELPGPSLDWECRLGLAGTTDQAPTSAEEPAILWLHAF